MRAILLLLVLICPACATLVRGTFQSVHFTSDPPGARVRFGNDWGDTPCTLKVMRSRRSQLATFEMAGRKPAKIRLVPEQTVDATMILHVMDSLTIVGGILNLKLKCFWDFPATINAKLEKNSSAEESSAIAY